jgi:hypothetical protein
VRFFRPAFPQFRADVGMSVSDRDLPLVAARSGTERACLRLAGKHGLWVVWRLIVKVGMWWDRFGLDD